LNDSSREGVIASLPPGTFSGLFQAIDGLRNRRAFAAMLGCMVIGVLVAGIFSLLATRLGFVLAFLGGLSMFVASATGISAAGVLLMDQARGVPSRALTDAVVYGLMCIPKFILLALTLFVVAVVVFIALAIVYLVCKIPVLGPILFVVVFPLSVVIAGLTLCGLFLCMFLALPAIWEGAPILRAITQALAIARTRLAECLLMLTVVGVLASAVGFIVFGVLFTGLVPAVTMAASIFGGDALGSMLGTMHSLSDASDEGSYGLAAGIGGMLLWSLTGSLVSLVYLLGLNIVYLRVTEGLDVSATEDALKARLDIAKRQATEFGQRAKDAAERAREQARQSAAAAQASANPANRPVDPAVAESITGPTPAPPPLISDRPAREAPPDSTSPAVAKALTCPHCLSAVARDDVYCGVCGYKL
jgi:hypothetical protein